MELVVRPLVNIIAYLAIATGILVGLWWIITVYAVHTRAKEHDLVHIDMPANLHEVETGIPPALIILFVFFAIAMVAYVLSVWAFGVTY